MITGLGDSDSRLIMELVANISPVPEILARHGLTAQGFKMKARNKMWVAAYREAREKWNSAASVQMRIKYKAGMLLEDLLPDMFIIAKDTSIPATSRAEMTKQLGQLSQTIHAARPGEGSDNMGAIVNINILGGEKVVVDGRSKAIEADPV